MKIHRVVSLIAVLLMASCSGRAPSPAPIATSIPPIDTLIPEPTANPQPTETPLPPTATLIPANTPLPEGVFFRDDFNGSLQPGWEWQNENPSAWEITGDGWLKIIGDSNSLLIDDRQSNLLWYPLPEGEYAITVHLQTEPFSDFHQAAIYIYADKNNYVALNRGFCGPCVSGGGGFFMELKSAGAWQTFKQASSAKDVYLRLELKDGQISGYYAIQSNDWIRLGRVGSFFEFKKVGIGVSNVGPARSIVGLFDYFEISEP